MKIGTEVFGDFRNVLERMEKIKWSETVTKQQVVYRIKREEDTCKQYPANWIGHIVRGNYLLTQMAEVKGEVRRT